MITIELHERKMDIAHTTNVLVHTVYCLTEKSAQPFILKAQKENRYNETEFQEKRTR